MKKFHKIDFGEVWAVVSSSTTKVKSLVFLLVVSILTLSVIIFGNYFFFVWVVMFILLTYYEDVLFKFITIDYQCLKPPLNTRPRNPNSVNELLNGFVLSDMRFWHPKIVFKVNNRNDRTAMKTFVVEGVDHIEIDSLAIKIYSKEEFQAVIYHELGHVALKHIDESKILIFFGYFVFIFLPIFLPLFWLVGSYISRYHELEADRFSLKNDPNHYMLKAVEGVKLERIEVSFWDNLWYNLLYVTVAPSPSLNAKIKSLRRFKAFYLK